MTERRRFAWGMADDAPHFILASTIEARLHKQRKILTVIHLTLTV